MPGKEAADAAEFVEHRRVQRQHRRGLGHAVAFENAQAEFFQINLARRFPHRLGAGHHVAQRAEVVRIGHARIAVEERVGAEQDGRAYAVNQLRHGAIMQRRRIEVDRHAGNQRQHDAAGEAERMEDRQRIEHLVFAAEIDPGRALRDVGEDVAVGKHDALRQAFGAGGEKDHAPVVGLARDQRFVRTSTGREAYRAYRSLGGCLPDRRCARPFASCATRFSSRPFSTKTREVRIVSISAARQAPRMLAAPALKLIIAGTRPADITASSVTTAPLEVGSMTPSGRALERERHQLGAEDGDGLQQPAIGQPAAHRVLDRQPAFAVDFRRLDERFDDGAVGRRAAEHQIGHDVVERRARGLTPPPALQLSGSSLSLTGSRMLTVIFGNSRRRTCVLFSRLKMVASGPSMWTGTTIASDLSAIIAGAIVDFHQAAGHGDAAFGKMTSMLPSRTALMIARSENGLSGSSAMVRTNLRNG